MEAPPAPGRDAEGNVAGFSCEDKQVFLAVAKISSAAKPLRI